MHTNLVYNGIRRAFYWVDSVLHLVGCADALEETQNSG